MYFRMHLISYKAKLTVGIPRFYMYTLCAGTRGSVATVVFLCIAHFFVTKMMRSRKFACTVHVPVGSDRSTSGRIREIYINLVGTSQHQSIKSTHHITLHHCT